MSRAVRTPDTCSGPARLSWAGKLAETIRQALRSIGEFRLRRDHREIPDPWRE